MSIAENPRPDKSSPAAFGSFSESAPFAVLPIRKQHLARSITQKVSPFRSPIEWVLKTVNRRRIRRYVRAATVNHRLKGPVLDVGCGYRTNEPEVGLAPYHTLDHNPDFAPTYVSDAEAMNVRSGSYNTVLLTEVLEHVREPEKVLAECHRVLAPRGILVVTMPFLVAVHEKPWQPDYRRLTKAGVALLLEQAGFCAVDVRAEPSDARPTNVFAIGIKVG